MEESKNKIFLDTIYTALEKDETEDECMLGYTYFKVFGKSSIYYSVLVKKDGTRDLLFPMKKDMDPRKFSEEKNKIVPRDIESLIGWEERIITSTSAYFLYSKGILAIQISPNKLRRASYVVANNEGDANEILDNSGIVWIHTDTEPNICQYLVYNKNMIRSHTINFGDFDYDPSGYNKDLPEDRICEFVKSDKEGLVLLYGKPGTGKSTFIKHLMNSNSGVNFVLLDSSFLDQVSNNELIAFMEKHKGAVYVLEDCEKALLRRERGGQNVNTVLNLTNGILGSSFRTKFICTFNTDLNNLDQALLRKGRLFLKYEFTNLGKSGKTISEIKNSEENDYSKESGKKIGF
jgi:hypothetical protein